jgi:hypothetical protein
MKRAFAALLLALAACDPPPAPPPPGEPPPELPALPDAPAPQVDEPDRIVLPSREGVVDLRWDFADRRLHSYRLTHESTTARQARFRSPLHEQNARQRFEAGREALTKKMKAEGKSDGEIARFMDEERRKFEKWLEDPLGTRVARMHSEGHVDFRGAGSERAKIEYRLAPLEYVADGVKEDVNKLPAMIFTAQMQEDGSIFDVNVRSGVLDPLLFDIVFALPARPLATGESFERPIDLPAKEDRPARRGTARTTLTGWAKVGPHECARLETLVSLEMASAPPAEGVGKLTGRVVAYFAPEARRFESAELGMAIHMRTRAQVAHGDGPKVWTVASLDTGVRFRAVIGR